MSYNPYNDKITEASVKDLVQYADSKVAMAYTAAKKGIDNSNPYAIAAAMAELKTAHFFLREWSDQLQQQ